MFVCRSANVDGKELGREGKGREILVQGDIHSPQRQPTITYNSA